MFTYSSGDEPKQVSACAPQQVCATIAYGQNHNAALVTPEQYEACTAPDATAATYSAGQTITIPAPTAGNTHHFICTLPGHCENNAKFKIVCDEKPVASTAKSETPTSTYTALGLGVSALLMV